MPTLVWQSGIRERGAVKASRVHLRQKPREDIRYPFVLRASAMGRH